MMLFEVTFEVLWFNNKSRSFEPSKALVAWLLRLIIIAQIRSHDETKKNILLLIGPLDRSQKPILLDSNQINQKLLQTFYNIFTRVY
jgi:hypothetical protein